MDRLNDARQLNSELGLVGLRAQATAVGLVQLCSELRSAGVLSDEAVARIKAAIADQIVVSYKPSRGREAFEASLHRRLDRLFPASRHDGEPAKAVGTSSELRHGLDLSDRAD
jgi:hypothetical protein